MLKQHFTTTLHAKPPASRSESAETYLVAKGFKGQSAVGSRQSKRSDL
jgi:23S rRNA (uridine2552-2'-O)-methyltransferase